MDRQTDWECPGCLRLNLAEFAECPTCGLGPEDKVVSANNDNTTFAFYGMWSWHQLVTELVRINKLLKEVEEITSVHEPVQP